MSPTVVPAPPGTAVSFADAGGSAAGAKAPWNLFAVGLFDRGDVAQGSGVAELLRRFGDRVTYSPATDALTAAIIEGNGLSWSIARVVGPAAATASVSLVDGQTTPAPSITVTATSAGDWANGADGGLTLEITAPTTTTRRVIVSEGGTVVATSPACDTTVELAAWENDYVTVTADGAGLPAVATTVNLAGGDDDRANITSTEWQVALGKLEKRWGPGTLLVFADDADVRAAAADHADARNRVVLAYTDASATSNDQITAATALVADRPDTAQHVGLFGAWAYTNAVAGDPERLVPWAAVQAGICARIHRAQGICAPAFGPVRGAAQIVTRLQSEIDDEARATLYAAGVNYATDDGTISTWGFRTVDPAPLDADLTHQYTRMGLRADGEAILASFIGSPGDADTLASLHARLVALGNEYIAARGLTEVAVDTDSLNTAETLAARELHALMRIKHTPTADWVDLVISIASYDQTI
ncbi:MAG: phage tail sheath subtilisin-like domain-containing protein [Patulibacter sp.]